MECPHCLKSFHAQRQIRELAKDQEGHWGVAFFQCPACARVIVYLGNCTHIRQNGVTALTDVSLLQLVKPKGANRPPPPQEVPKQYSEDYKEACIVLPDSAKASAALSRRCLQHLLRGEAKVKHQDLFKEIQDVIDGATLPSHIAESLDAVRNIGNFAAHPIKSQSTGEIVPVEAGEAEWNLDVLESLFDFYFVAPARTKARKDALNKKLADSGKPPVK